MTDHTVSMSEGIWGGRLLLFESLPSTNKWALDNVRSLMNGDVVRAVRQTAGRGRFDRKWVSSEDKCLTLSIVIQPDSADDRVVPIATQLAALAVRSVLQGCSIKAQLKWPNDLLVGGRKISGILAERDPETGILILGIGLNVNLTAKDLQEIEPLQPATSMAIEKTISFDVAAIANQLLAELSRTISSARQSEMAALFETWRQFDALTGTTITVRTHDANVSGKYAGMNSDGRLRLLDDSGCERLFWSGDVSLSDRTQCSDCK